MDQDSYRKHKIMGLFRAQRPEEVFDNYKEDFYKYKKDALKLYQKQGAFASDSISYILSKADNEDVLPYIKLAIYGYFEAFRPKEANKYYEQHNEVISRDEYLQICLSAKKYYESAGLFGEDSLKYLTVNILEPENKKEKVKTSSDTEIAKTEKSKSKKFTEEELEAIREKNQKQLINESRQKKIRRLLDCAKISSKIHGLKNFTIRYNSWRDRIGIIKTPVIYLKYEPR